MNCLESCHDDHMCPGGRTHIVVGLVVQANPRTPVEDPESPVESLQGLRLQEIVVPLGTRQVQRKLKLCGKKKF